MSSALSVAPSVQAVMPKLPWRALVLIAGVLIAYHYSLMSLIDGLGLQTPLGYLALVPFLALFIGATTFVTEPRLRSIHDRQLDWIVGLALIAAAAVVDLILPSAYTADFWLHRIDLIGLPFFVAGLVAILYGVRRLWTLRWAILFLLLAWPVPFETVLASAVGWSTTTTVAIVETLSRYAPIAQPVSDGTFVVTHAGTPFAVSVGSACSGINSIVGFLLLGTAWNAVLRGSLVRRVAWLVAGFLIIGVLNVARIESIFVAGALLGPQFAFDLLHPVAGLVAFGIGFAIMFALARPFGLTLPAVDRGHAVQRRVPSASPSVKRTRRQAIERLMPPAVALAFALALAVPNQSFDRYDPVSDGFGNPEIAAIDPSALVIPGWTGSTPTTFDQATQFFGPHATWERIAYSIDTASAGPAGSAPGPVETVYLDVIRTDSGSAMGAYGVEDCYSFHGFRQVSNQAVDIGAGVTAKAATYLSPDNGTDWSLLWWEWPYAAGNQTRYERIALLVPLNNGAPVAQRTGEFTSARDSLAGIADTIVAQTMKHPVDTNVQVVP